MSRFPAVAAVAALAALCVISAATAAETAPAPAAATATVASPALHIVAASARATVPGQQSGAVYLSIQNRGKHADRLLSASSPAAASVAIHSMKMDGNVMKMREVDALTVPAATTVSLQSDSGYHVMLSGLKAPLQAGAAIKLILVFAQAGTLAVTVPVAAQGAAAAVPMHHH
jgi:copper(I)-binding protein